MFDDFDITIQSDEIIPEEYNDWCKWMYSEEPAEAQYPYQHAPSA